MLVSDLRKALEGVSDNMELVVGCGGNQHGVYDCGIARCGNDGMFEMLEEGDEPSADDEIDFFING